MKLFNWFKNNGKKTDGDSEKIQHEANQIEPKEQFRLLISEVIKPILKENNYKKKSLTFYKSDGDLTYVLNFQRSLENTAEKAKFYLNCGIYSSQIDKTLDGIEIKEPKEYECHYTVRIGQLKNTGDDGYIIDKTTDIDALKSTINSDLNFALELFDKILTLPDLIKQMIEHNSKDFDLFEYLVLKDDNENLKRQLIKMHSFWGYEKQWKSIRKNLNIILKTHNKDYTIDSIIDSI
jgi:hypothetical protein